MCFIFFFFFGVMLVLQIEFVVRFACGREPGRDEFFGCDACVELLFLEFIKIFFSVSQMGLGV